MRPLRTLLVTALTLVVVPSGLAPAHATDEATITGVARDPDGTPLPNVTWTIHAYEDGEWTSPLQFGPRLTDGQGRFEWEMPLGGQYRVCFHDTYYGNATTPGSYWQPEVRHRDTCWPNATSVESAQTWTPTARDSSKTFAVTMPVQGLGMAPVDPFIVGTYEIGEPLTIVGQEGWRPTNATFSYQWWSSTDGPAAPIPGATGATYVPTPADEGKWVYAQVTASRPGYKPAALVTPLSRAGGVHVRPTSPLAITGDAVAGGTLTASFGRPGNTYSEIDWFVDGVPQPEHKTYDSDRATFPVAGAHAGARVEARMRIYRRDAEGHYVDGSDASQRAQVQVAGERRAQPLPPAPAPAGEPAIGRTLAAPSVTADPAATVQHQWIRGGKAVKGATSPRYKLTKADLGKKVKVEVTVTRPGWWGTYVTTSEGTVAKRALKKGNVKVVGKARVGQKLKARTPGWGPKPVKIRFQWLRNGKAIKGAKKKAYKIKKADRGKKLKVRVTVKKPMFATVTKTSKGRKVRR
ncbi:hypothetical protein IEQ44_13615 [Nocardioides sp. Y6]|uniref:Carboxypeptidase regulatory-like domain-containing protein n=1 Tax=Nocardioides malaquae TaxID=2773426 RepID=A0ABR9RWE3_9ACTN|nr:hypothetical protein [Nocardioides malaquae]MBE7325685.1 hypothetical protein [Nocardioides malaquae]